MRRLTFPLRIAPNRLSARMTIGERKRSMVAADCIGQDDPVARPMMKAQASVLVNLSDNVRRENRKRRSPDRRLSKSAVGKSPLLGSICRAGIPACRPKFPRQAEALALQLLSNRNRRLPTRLARRTHPLHRVFMET